jgi:hypothetical protein
MRKKEKEEEEAAAAAEHLGEEKDSNSQKPSLGLF